MLKRTGFKPKVPALESTPMKGPRQKKCKLCRKLHLGEKEWCSDDCAVELALSRVAKQKLKKARAERAETKAKLQAIEPLEYWLKRAERAFNAFIRQRDEGQGCISCGRTNADVFNAGHFVSVGANRTLRFNEDNVHLQCARPCNMDKGGNIHEYRKGLLLKIGAERLAIIEGWHPPEKMTRALAQAVEEEYKRKLKELKNVSA